MVDWRDPKVYFKVLVAVNFLNYLDRGIIPGSTNEFNGFISDNVETDKPDVYLGLLQSAFIVGFSLASIYFGNAVHKHRPFLLVSAGLAIWTVAVFMCGLAYYAESYAFLALARMLSGVGEASFQCSMPPWITRYAGPGKGGTWLAIFYTAIPVGTAAGYAYSAAVSSSLGWSWAFWIEGLTMVPFVVFLFFTKHYFKRECDLIKEDEALRLAEAAEVQSDAGSVRSVTLPPELVSASAAERTAVGQDNQMQMMESKKKREGGFGEDEGGDEENSEAPTVWEELKIVIQSPIYLMLMLGYAAQTGALIGLSTFGSAFIMALGFYDNEQEASSIFGVVISLAGIFGTPLGGWAMDKWNDLKMSGGEANEMTRLETSLSVITICSGIGTVVMCLLYEAKVLWLWMTLVCLGCGIIFGSQSGINIACMLSVHQNHRSFAIAFMTVVMHALGDVPSPIIVGLLKDSWAPGCVAGADDDEVAASDACRDDKEGIRLTMLVTTLWLCWTFLLFALCLYLFHRRKLAGGGFFADERMRFDEPLLKTV